MTKKTGLTTMSNKTGVYFCGVVEERRKRMVPKDDPKTEVVTYSFYDEDSRRNYYIDDYAPDSYYEVGEYVEVMVRIKPYINKSSGRPAYSMTIMRPFEKNQSPNSNGEVF